jgi:hypothetical protein
MTTRAADDFEAIRAGIRAAAELEQRCSCPKFESGSRIGETDEACPVHGKWLGERKGKQA